MKLPHNNTHRCSLVFVRFFPPQSALTSISCDVSKGKIGYVIHCTYVSFQADYGSPMVANNRLVAIYAWGVACGSPEYPDLYTKVADVCDWIAAIAGL
jgi:secreted trypsin-like serine protease